MKTLLAALLLVPSLSSAQSSDRSFAAALCAVRAKAAAAVKATPVKGAKPAALRSEAARPAAAALKLCDEAMAKHVTGSYGGPNLMLRTETMAYYTHQDCDICDELDACELATGKLSTLKTAHMIGCQDLAPYRKGKISYDACGPIR